MSLAVLIACASPSPSGSADVASSAPSTSGTGSGAGDASSDDETGGGDSGPTGTVSPPLLSWLEADNGGLWSCGLVSDGTVRCWGADFCDGLGPPTDQTFTQISLGYNAMCGVRTDGSVGCWCCAAPLLPDDGSSEICASPPAGTFQRVEVGTTRACAQDGAGFLTCWGAPGSKGQPHEPVGDFGMEESEHVAVLLDGSIFGWGSGDLWGGDTPPAGVVFAHVADGRTHACGLDVGGVPYCWGNDGAPDYVYGGLEPFPDPPAGTYAQISGYDEVTCVIDASGTATCWWGGDPDYWVVPMPENVQFAQIGLGEGNACGVSLGGEIYCWGGSAGPWLTPPALNP